MIDFKRFVLARVSDIQRQIDELPAHRKEKGKELDFLSDKVFYETALAVVEDYESERAFESSQASR